MRVICAWCQKVIKPADGSGLPDSHGICPPCKDKFYPAGGVKPAELNSREKRGLAEAGAAALILAGPQP